MARPALIVVDVQNDFCPGGALAVPEGDSIVPVLNRYVRLFGERGWPVFASRDWHPARTGHFRDFGGAWPVHCVRGTAGAELHRALQLPPDATIVSKGQDPDSDGYSAFQATTTEEAGLAAALASRAVDRVWVGGLATDYCVKATVLDALARGLRASFLIDASRGVNLKPHDSELAIAEMVRAGADVVTLERPRL
ncbi:MAG: bifunctional nicotinamidase/pyrazinamidase [Chloroflexota bacterium]